VRINRFKTKNNLTFCEVSGDCETLGYRLFRLCLHPAMLQSVSIAFESSNATARRNIAFQSRAPIDHSRTCSYNLDFDLMTSFIYRSKLDIPKTYLHTKTNFLGQCIQRLEHYRQTDTDATGRTSTQHSRLVTTTNRTPTREDHHATLRGTRSASVRVNASEAAYEKQS